MQTPPVPYRLTFDDQLFFLINHLPHNAVLDALFLTLSGVGTAGIIWFLLAVWLFVREEKKDHWFFAPLLSAGAVSWLFVEQILKPLIARPRPAEYVGAIILEAASNGSFSFPSGHATIAWALAPILAEKEPRWRWGLYALAFLISFSRIYIGKHFPLDVAVGGLLGWIIGKGALHITTILKPRP